MLGAKELNVVERVSLQMFPTDLTLTVNSKELVQQPRNPWLQSLFKLLEQKVGQNLIIEAFWAFLQQWAINVNMDCDLFRDTGS